MTSENKKKFFYCNSMEIAYSSFDINFKLYWLGSASESEGGTNNGVEKLDELFITMSPEHAKAMLPGLFNAVKLYENDIGKIQLKKEIQESYDAIMSNESSKK